MRLIDADELTRRIEQSYLTKGEKRLFSVKVRHMPTFVIDERPFVCIEGKIVYITQGHIDALIKYEEDKMTKEFVEDFMKTLDDVKRIGGANNG